LVQKTSAPSIAVDMIVRHLEGGELYGALHEEIADSNKRYCKILRPSRGNAFEIHFQRLRIIAY